MARTLLDLPYDEAPRADFDRLVEAAGDDPEPAAPTTSPCGCAS